jgi:hypothetical protein
VCCSTPLRSQVCTSFSTSAFALMFPADPNLLDTLEAYDSSVDSLMKCSNNNYFIQLR